MTTNNSGTPSDQRASGSCCAIGCSVPRITHTTHGWKANYTTSTEWPRPLFYHQARIWLRCPPSRVVPRILRAGVDRCSLQPRISTETVTPTQSSNLPNISSNKNACPEVHFDAIEEAKFNRLFGI